MINSNVKIYQANIPSLISHERGLLYKPKPINYNLIQRNKKSAVIRFSSSSTKNHSHSLMVNQEKEIQAINREIKLKTKEYEEIKKETNKVEEENMVILNILDSLLAECQEIDDPLERRAKDIDNLNSKTQILINKLKNKYDLFKKELTIKEETLRKLKEDEKTVRSYELDGQIKETTKNLEQVKKDQKHYIHKINRIDLETNRAKANLKNLMNQNNLLKNEKRDFLNKTKALTKESENLDKKRIALEEKVNSMQNNLDQLINSIEKNSKEMDSLKEKEELYNEVTQEKFKYDKTLSYQMKNIISLSDQINKLERRKKEDEKMINGFRSHIKVLHDKENELNNDDIVLEDLKNKKIEKENIIVGIKKLNELILKYRVKKYDISKFTIVKNKSFELISSAPKKEEKAVDTKDKKEDKNELNEPIIDPNNIVLNENNLDEGLKDYNELGESQ